MKALVTLKENTHKFHRWPSLCAIAARIILEVTDLLGRYKRNYAQEMRIRLIALLLSKMKSAKLCAFDPDFNVVCAKITSFLRATSCQLNK